MHDFRFPVEVGQVLAFARAVGDSRAADIAVTADHTTDIPVPPTFVQASAHFDPDYTLRPQPGQCWHGSAAGPGQAPAGGTGLHAEQRFTYHRPVRVGDILTASRRQGESWTKQGRSGELIFTEHLTDYHDQTGEPVLTACTVAVLRRPNPAGGAS